MSSRFTAMDVEKQEFTRKVRGYDPDEVRIFLSAVAEEAFFRGALQPQLGLPATSLLFALAHFAPRRDLLPWTAFALAAGFALGALFEATGNLVAPTLAHAVVNAINLWLLSRDYR